MGEGVTRSKDGVPQWDGDSRSFQEYEEMSLQWEQGIPTHKRYLCGPRLLGELTGIARKYVVGKRPDWLSYNGGVEHLLGHLRLSLGRPQLPELSEYLTRYFRQSRRHKGESMNSYIVKEERIVQQSQTGLVKGPSRPSSTRSPGYLLKYLDYLAAPPPVSQLVEWSRSKCHTTTIGSITCLRRRGTARSRR